MIPDASVIFENVQIILLCKCTKMHNKTLTKLMTYCILFAAFVESASSDGFAIGSTKNTERVLGTMY